VRNKPVYMTYSPECAEGAFSEVELPLYGFLGSSLRFLADHTLRVFAYYRFALAAVAVVLLSSGS
jgi:hypothetical protein